MTKDEIKYIRESLNLSRSVCAKEIGGVDRVAWFYYETGRYSIAAGSDRKLRSLVSFKKECFKILNKNKEKKIKIYKSSEDFNEDYNLPKIYYFIYESLVRDAYVYLNYELVECITEFNEQFITTLKLSNLLHTD